MKQMIILSPFLTTFEANVVFEASGGISEKWLQPKTKSHNPV
jgi:hypothetical protein